MSDLLSPQDPQRRGLSTINKTSSFRPSTKGITFENFITFFEVIELPINVTSDLERQLTNSDDPLSEMWAQRFLMTEEDVIDDFTEFQACFRLPQTNKTIALVHWEASLQGSSFYLSTFAPNGILINKQRIAGTKYGQEKLEQTVCTIREDRSITLVSGSLDAKTTSILTPTEDLYETILQLTDDGELIEV